MYIYNICIHAVPIMYIVLFLTINRSQPSIAHQFTEMMTVPLLTAACQRLCRQFIGSFKLSLGFCAISKSSI